MKKEIFISVMTRLVVIGAGFITSILTARILGVEGRGEYFYIITATTLISQFSNLGLQSSNTFYVAKDRSLCKQINTNSLWVALIVSLVGCCLFILFDFLLSGHYKPYNWYVFIITPFSLYFLLGSNILIGINKIIRFNYHQIVYTFLSLVLIVGSISLSEGAVAAVLLASGIANFIASLGLWKEINRGLAIKLFSLSLFRMQISYSFRAYLVTLIGMLVLRLNVFILEILYGKSEIGLYSIASQLADILCVIPITVAMVLFPKLVQSGSDQWNNTVVSVKNILALMLISVLLTIWLAEWFIDFVFSDLYADSYLILMAMLPGVVFLSLATIYSQYLAANNFPKRLIAIWLVVLSSLVVGDYYLIPIYQGVGAAMGLSTAYFILLVLVYLLSRSVRNSIKEASE